MQGCLSQKRRRVEWNLFFLPNSLINILHPYWAQSCILCFNWILNFIIFLFFFLNQVKFSWRFNRYISFFISYDIWFTNNEISKDSYFYGLKYCVCCDKKLGQLNLSKNEYSSPKILFTSVKHAVLFHNK